jgi:hypothetical protein
MCSDMEFYNLLFREKYSGGNLIFLFDMSLFTIIIVLKFPESNKQNNYTTTFYAAITRL